MINADTTGVAKLWRGYLAPCGEVIKSVARLPVARLPCGEVTVMLQSNISLESATFQLHFGFSSSFSAILHLNFIGKHIVSIYSALTTLNTNTETSTAIHTAHNLTVWAVMGIYYWHYHVKNKKYGNFVSIFSLTGKCTAQKLKKNFCSSILWTCFHHMVIIISKNRITVFFMILA